MAEKLRLKKADTTKIRISIAVLVAIILASMAAGYVIAQQLTVTGNVVKENCIPEDDFLAFIDDYNLLREDYQQCVADLWALDLTYKQALTNTEQLS